MRSLIVTTVVVSSLALTACGGDDDDASAAPSRETGPTVEPATAASDVEEYCAELAALDEGRDPGFDQFFADHPEPALEGWAAFLPGPTEMLSDMLEPLEIPFGARCGQFVVIGADLDLDAGRVRR